VTDRATPPCHAQDRRHRGQPPEGSFNAALLRAAADRCPSGAEIEIASIADIPLYDGDVEAGQGVPAAVLLSELSPGSRPSSVLRRT
jgi:hypothetical protein